MSTCVHEQLIPSQAADPLLVPCQSVGATALLPRPLRRCRLSAATLKRHSTQMRTCAGFAGMRPLLHVLETAAKCKQASSAVTSQYTLASTHSSSQALAEAAAGAQAVAATGMPAVTPQCTAVEMQVHRHERGALHWLR